MSYQVKQERYGKMEYRRSGASGLKLPVMSLGLWHNFGNDKAYEGKKEIILKSFDQGITHFDLANNYGNPAGSAEQTMGRVLREELGNYRDELIISTKAGFEMWEGPYGGAGGSKKYLVASLDQSLKRMGLSNYEPQRLKEASDILEKMGQRCLLHQHHFSMLERGEKKLLPVIREKRMGAIAYCPLEQGLLTDKYLNGIPKDSRVAGPSIFLKKERISPAYLEKVRKLDKLAGERGQSLAQMALAFALMDGELTSVILGASRFSQIEENLKALDHLSFTEEERQQIETILA